MEDSAFATACELAAAIREHEVSAVEVLEVFLDRFERHNPSLNAIVTLGEEGAMEKVREADAALERGESWGPLHGVPITLEDCHATAGIRSTWGGHPSLADHVPFEDSVVAARLKAAGAVVFGKTNGPEVWGPEGVFDRTNNTWDLERTPGGSSSGPGAALAAGLTPRDIGLDTLGSIQSPAHCCGVFGMRPTERRVSLKGSFFIDPIPKFHIMSVAGPMARSVEDLRLALRLIAGPDHRDPSVPPLPWRDAPAPTMSDLRLAWSPTLPGVPVPGEMRVDIEELAGELGRRGAHVQQCLPELDFAEQHDFAQRTFELIAGTFGEAEMPTPLDDYLTALHRREAFVVQWDRFFREWDALICPVEPTVAERHDDEVILVDGEPVTEAQRDIPSMSSPVSGCPTVVIPLTLSHDGLPIGVQVMGSRWDDERLLAIAESLSEMAGGFRRPPGY